MIVLESTPDDTENAILEGTFALISPVITLTEGLCVAMTRWIPAALASCDNERKAKNYRLPGGGQSRMYVVDREAMDIEGGST